MKLKFKVVEYGVNWGQHHWKAIDCQNEKEISFLEHNDGNNDMFGEYPSIQKYLLDEYNINILLSYSSTNRNPDINEEHTECVWTFSDDENNEVKIIDIPRTTLRVTSIL